MRAIAEMVGENSTLQELRIGYQKNPIGTPQEYMLMRSMQKNMS